MKMKKQLNLHFKMVVSQIPSKDVIATFAYTSLELEFNSVVIVE